MEKDKMIEQVKIMHSQVKAPGFALVSGRAQFLRDIDELVFFLETHSTGPSLNDKMFKEIKTKFDALVKRTQIYEKES